LILFLLVGTVASIWYVVYLNRTPDAPLPQSMLDDRDEERSP
jgi:hypothetical protein